MALFFWLPWELPNLNELIRQRGVRFSRKSGKRPSQSLKKEGPGESNGYQQLKKKWESAIATVARARGFEVPPGLWDFTYLFVEPNTRRDPSNVVSGAVKLIEDALVKMRLMEGDGWATVRSIHSHFLALPAHREPDIACTGVLLAVAKTPATLQEMIEQAARMSHAERFHRRERDYAASRQRLETPLGAGVPGGDAPLAREATGASASPGAPVPAQHGAERGEWTAGAAAGNQRSAK